MLTSFGGVSGGPVESGTYTANIPSYVNQLASVSSFAGHSGLEEVPPIFTIGQPESLVYPSKSVSSFPVHMESSHFYPSETGNTYDSTESLPVYVNPSFGHPKELDVFVTLKVPAHAQPLAAQFAHHLCTSRRSDPLLIVPSDTNTSGYMSVLSDNCSFLCSRNGIGGGFHVMPIPATSSFLEVHNKSTPPIQSGGRVIRAPHSGFVVVTPEGDMHYIQRPMIILPGNAQRPLMELPLLSSDGSSVQLDDIVNLLINLREGAANATTSGTLPRDQSTVDNAQMRQQDANYFSLPLNASRQPVQQQPAPHSSTFARHIGFRPPLIPGQQQIPIRMPTGSAVGITPTSFLDYSSTNRPSVPNARQPLQQQQQQQLLASALAASGIKIDQMPLQLQPNMDYVSLGADYF